MFERIGRCCSGFSRIVRWWTGFLWKMSMFFPTISSALQGRCSSIDRSVSSDFGFMYCSTRFLSANIMLVGAFSIIEETRAISFSLMVRSRAAETDRDTERSASIRSSEMSRVSRAKKSIVPMTSSSTMTGKQTPDFTPADRAAGARTQSVTVPRSRSKTRSRAAQVRPDRPTPLSKVAVSVTCRNSSVTVPDSWSNRSVSASGS